MFDLNQFPEQASDQLDAGTCKTPPAPTEGVVEESKTSRHGEFLPAGTGNVDTLSSTLTFEPTRQHPIENQVALEERLVDVEEKEQSEVRITSTLQVGQPPLKHSQEVEILPGTGLLIGTTGTLYPLLSSGAAEASTSRNFDDLRDVHEKEDQTAFPPEKKILETHIQHHQLSLDHRQGKTQAAGFPEVCLSLGSAIRSLEHRKPLELKRCTSSLKKTDVFDLALSQVDDWSHKDSALPSFTARKNADIPPFWCGKLRTDGPLLTPVNAYCLGIMKSDSLLKKLPTILSSQKFVKQEEFMKSLQDGVGEPVTQFKPSVEASSEEVNRFNLMVEALSHGSGLTQSASIVGLDLGQKKSSIDGTFPYSAVLISWEEAVANGLDVKLYLISFQSFQELVKDRQLNADFLEETDVLDSNSLYGIFCNHGNSYRMNDKDVGRSRGVSSNKGSDASLVMTMSSTEKGKDLVPRISALVPRSSPSRIKRHVSQFQNEVLTRSASLEPKGGPCKDYEIRYDLERGSRRRYERQTSGIHLFYEARTKHYSRHSNDADEEDFDTQKMSRKEREKLSWSYGRHSQREEQHGDKLKDTARWSRDDRDLGKERSREHHRHPQHESERGWRSKANDEHMRNHDRNLHKQKERPSKDSSVEIARAKHLERTSSRSRTNTSSICRSSPDRELRKDNKKREREDEKENVVQLKRVREAEEATSSQSSDQLARDTSADSQHKVSIDRDVCYPQAESEQAGKLHLLESIKESHGEDEATGKPLLSLGDCNANLLSLGDPSRKLAATATDSHGLDDELIKPLFSGKIGAKAIESHGLTDEVTKPLFSDVIIESKQEGYEDPMSKTKRLSEMILGSNLLSLSMVEDVVPSSWVETLGDSLLSGADKGGKEGTNLEFVLDGPTDKETRTWLMSKQNSLYLQEEYGVDVTIIPEVSNLGSSVKSDLQSGSLQVRISMGTSKACDAAEARWFVEQAATFLKSIAVRGVFIKCLWYEGPVQIHPGDGAPSVPVIVKKIKGEDGKNLDRIQEEMGVMIGVVLRKSGVSAPNELEPMSRPRFIGLRLKCIRRKGLVEACREAEALLESVAEHFSKELATHIATHIEDLQELVVQHNEEVLNQESPTNLALYTKDLLSGSSLKDEVEMVHDPTCSPMADDLMLLASPQKSSLKLSERIIFPKEEPEPLLCPELERASRPLFVSNLPEHITPNKIRNIFENVLKEKLEPFDGLESSAELVVDVRYKPEKYCAFVELANDALVNTCLKSYKENKTLFNGLTVELGLSNLSRPERQVSFSKSGAQSKGSVSSREHTKSSINGEYAKGMLLGRGTEDHVRSHGKLEDESDSDYSQDVWRVENGGSLDKPRPLYLTELMRNASAQTINKLFEDIITTYIDPSLVSSSSRQLVLDVRYVPTRGCAFVDLATPELVEFMLDLHSRRPEVFMNMKMELGRKPVPYVLDEEIDRRSGVRTHGKSQYGSQTHGYRLTHSASWKKLEKRPSASHMDYLDDSDKGDDLSRQHTRLKKQRSDPEKTIYADRLPESASEGIIKKIFERVLLQNLAREEMEAVGENLITEVRHIPTKYCAFVVFATEELTRLVLHLYNQDEDVFESMRLKPHFHSRMEDLYKEDMQDTVDVLRPSGSIRERKDIDEYVRLRDIDLHESRSRLAVHRAITATAFKEVDRRRSVYVDRIPEDLTEYKMTEIFEKVFRHRKHGQDGHMVSQVAYFRDKFDPSKLCAFVEVKSEDGTQELVDFYNANPDAFMGMRVRPGFKYSS